MLFYISTFLAPVALWLTYRNACLMFGEQSNETSDALVKAIFWAVVSLYTVAAFLEGWGV
jgi:uncharacterized Tic20 family protein